MVRVGAYFLEPLRRFNLIDRPFALTGPNSPSLRLIRSENTSSTLIYLHPEVNYLTKTEKNDLVKVRIGAARLKYKQARSQAEKHKIIQDYFGAGLGKPEYLTHPVFQQFVKDSEKGDYYQTRALLSKLKPNFVIGVFQTPWSPELKTESLEGMTFDEEDYGLKTDYPSNAVAIKNVLLSKGFTNEIFVALFPENFVVANENLRKGEDFDAYYIVDSFISRYHKYTERIIATHAPEVFPSLKNISQEDLQYAIATWLSAHEYFHTTGPIPRVYRHDSDEESNRVNRNKEYGFYLKNTKEGGAFEEMRVDLNTLVRLGTATMQAESKGKATLIRDFILAERLLRYIAQKNPYDHFDSTVQLVLTHHLIKEGVLTIDDKNQIRLGNFSKLTESLASLLNQVNELETKISQEKDLSIPKDFGEAEEMICKFMRDRARPAASFNAEDAKFLDEFSSTKAQYTAEMRLAKEENDLEKQKKLRKEFAVPLKVYFERFYPLQPFHKALRKTLKPYLPQEKKTSTAKPQMKKKDFEPLTTTTLHQANSSSAKSLQPAEIIIKSSRTDLKNIHDLPKDASREEYDKAFVEILRQDTNSGGFDPTTIKGTLQIIALQSPSKFVDDIKTKKLLLFAHLDAQNRIDAASLKDYNQLIFDLYQGLLSELNSTEQERFLSNLKRILRLMLRETGDKDFLAVSLKSWQNELNEIRAHQKTIKDRFGISISASIGLLALTTMIPLVRHRAAIDLKDEAIKHKNERKEIQTELQKTQIKLKNEITKKRSISDLDFKGIYNEDLEKVHQNIKEGPLISRIMISILTSNIKKDRLAECEIKQGKELIDTKLSRNGKNVQIFCSVTNGDILRIEDKGLEIHVTLPQKLIQELLDISDGQLEATLLQMRKDREFQFEINPKFLPIRHPRFNMPKIHLGRKPSTIEESDYIRIISPIAISLLKIALEKHSDHFRGEIVDDKTFSFDGQQKEIQFAVQIAPPDSNAQVIITKDPISDDLIVLIPNTIPRSVMEYFDKAIDTKSPEERKILSDPMKLKAYLEQIIFEQKVLFKFLR